MPKDLPYSRDSLAGSATPTRKTLTPTEIYTFKTYNMANSIDLVIENMKEKRDS